MSKFYSNFKVLLFFVKGIVINEMHKLYLSTKRIRALLGDKKPPKYCSIQ